MLDKENFTKSKMSFVTFIFYICFGWVVLVKSVAFYIIFLHFFISFFYYISYFLQGYKWFDINMHKSWKSRNCLNWYMARIAMVTLFKPKFTNILLSLVHMYLCFLCFILSISQLIYTNTYSNNFHCEYFKFRFSWFCSLWADSKQCCH